MSTPSRSRNTAGRPRSFSVRRPQLFQRGSHLIHRDSRQAFHLRRTLGGEARRTGNRRLHRLLTGAGRTRQAGAGRPEDPDYRRSRRLRQVHGARIVRHGRRQAGQKRDRAPQRHFARRHGPPSSGLREAHARRPFIISAEPQELPAGVQEIAASAQNRSSGHALVGPKVAPGPAPPYARDPAPLRSPPPRPKQFPAAAGRRAPAHRSPAGKVARARAAPRGARKRMVLRPQVPRARGRSAAQGEHGRAEVARHPGPHRDSRPDRHQRGRKRRRQQERVLACSRRSIAIACRKEWAA